MSGENSHHIAIIGAGPRGSSVLERLAANWRANKASGALEAGAGLTVHVIDPYPAGSGHVWQPGQSRQFLMNTQSFFPTLTSQDPALAAPVAGGTFDQWRASVDPATLTEPEQAELAGLSSADFPSRALYGRYLENTLAAVVDGITSDDTGFEVRFHRAEALAVHPAHDAGHAVTLSTGETLLVGSVVLAIGHTPSALSHAQTALANGALRYGLDYFPPACPADVDWSLIPAGESVLVRGMGLNFFDVLSELTLGRGGSFETAQDGRLIYRPSGREPVLYAGSRRGTPYKGKADISSYYGTTPRLRQFSAAGVNRLVKAGIEPGFMHDVWPLLHRDVLRAYYGELVQSHPELVESVSDFLAGLDDLLTPHAHAAENWKSQVDAYLDRQLGTDQRLDLRALAAPFAGQKFASPEEFQEAVLASLDADAAASARAERDPDKAAVLTLHAGRSLIKDIVADGGITDESWQTELRGGFESLVEGLASGPPSLRIRQLAALARAGVVHFLGPEPRYVVDENAGEFAASSPWVESSPVRGRTMIEALAPANRVGTSSDPLTRQLLDSGTARVRLMMGPEGAPAETSGFDVHPHPYRLIGDAGETQESLYVLGLQLSSAQWGVAIAAESYVSDEQGRPIPAFPSSQRTLRDADEIARDILAHL